MTTPTVVHVHGSDPDPPPLLRSGLTPTEYLVQQIAWKCEEHGPPTDPNAEELLELLLANW